MMAKRSDSAPNSSPTLRLAEFVSRLRFEDAPQNVVSHVKLCILDTLGCANNHTSLDALHKIRSRSRA